MNLMIKTHNIAVTKALKDYAEKKLERLQRFFDNIQEITIDLDVTQASDENQTQVASALIIASGTMIKGKEASKDMYASIDMLYDKLEVQLKKHKEKLRDSRHIHSKSQRTLTLGSKSKDAVKERKLVEEELEARFIKKPIGPDDAIEILEERSLSFLVFTNMEDERISVVYPLGDHSYGLIET